MKKTVYLFLFLLFFLSFMLTNTISANKNYSVYIDPGHGGLDKGAKVNDILESDLNLNISVKLKEILEEKGIKVYLTRDGDYDLSTNKNRRKKTDAVNRCNLINQSDCNLYISIHQNTYINSKYSGAQVFYNNINKKNILLASYIEDAFKLYLNQTRNKAHLKNIYMIENITKPGVFVECGFMTNPNELELLTANDYQTKIAYTIYLGISNFLNVS